MKKVFILLAVALFFNAAQADIRHTFYRKGTHSTIVTLVKGEKTPSVQMNISGIRGNDRAEFLKILQNEMQKNVQMRMEVTISAARNEDGARSMYASDFYITTGMRHMTTPKEADALFESADIVLRQILDNVYSKVDEVSDANSSGRKF